MRMPIIGICDGYLLVFPNKESAEIYIEPIDVENNEWEAFDAEGRILILEVVAKKHWCPLMSIEDIAISESQPAAYAIERLRTLLLNYLSGFSETQRAKLGITTASFQSATLEQLVAYAVALNPCKSIRDQ